jgi:hypothetical protein
MTIYAPQQIHYYFDQRDDVFIGGDEKGQEEIERRRVKQGRVYVRSLL